MADLVLKVVLFEEAASAIESIRRIVFQEEQGVKSALDFDGLDPSSLHIVADLKGQPVGTARIRRLADGVKLERMAVLAGYRGQGIGQKLVGEAIAWASSHSVSQIKLNAQVQAKEFYKKLGFESYGDEFEEAGIIHIAMHQFIEARI